MIAPADIIVNNSGIDCLRADILSLVEILCNVRKFRMFTVQLSFPNIETKIFNDNISMRIVTRQLHFVEILFERSPGGSGSYLLDENVQISMIVARSSHCIDSEIVYFPDHKYTVPDTIVRWTRDILEEVARQSDLQYLR